MQNRLWELVREDPIKLLRVENACAWIIVSLSCCAFFFGASLQSPLVRFIFALSGIWILFGFCRGIIFAVLAGQSSSHFSRERAIAITRGVVSELIWFVIWFRLTPVLVFISLALMVLPLGEDIAFQNPMLCWAVFVTVCVFIPPAVRKWFARHRQRRLAKRKIYSRPATR